jgi:hypothetical protein
VTTLVETVGIYVVGATAESTAGAGTTAGAGAMTTVETGTV